MARGELEASAVGLRALSVLLGVFVLFMGIDKIAWFADDSRLAGLFQEWRGAAPAYTRWYLDRVAIPGLPVFARLVPLAELSVGVALITGFQARLAAALMLFMVVNFHFASDVMFHYSYLINAYGLPVISGLLALVIGGKRLPLSVFARRGPAEARRGRHV